MNIQFQICGLSILVLLLFVYKSHRTLGLYSETIFRGILQIILVSLIMDILSLVVIRYRQGLPGLLVFFICKTYIITLVWGTLFTFLYVLSDLMTEGKHRRFSRIVLPVLLLETVLIYLLPIHIYDHGAAVYTYGPAVSCVYSVVGVHILATLLTAVFFGKHMNPRRRFSAISWMILWIAGAMIQFLRNELLIVGFASAMGVLILFVIMEDPEGNLERRLDCFNSYALTQYLTHLYQRKEKFSLLEISLEHLKLSGQESVDTNALFQKMLEPLDKTIMALKIWIFL